MFSLEWLQSRGANRGKPGLPGGHGRRLVVLGALCAASLLQTGCQSGPFSPCGFVGRTTSRIMRPFRHGQDACCGAEAGGCVTSGMPVESMAPGTTVLPGPSAPSGVDSPQSLEPLPKGSIGPAPSSPTGRAPINPTTGIKTGSTYETLRPDDRLSRSRADNLAHALVSTPVPAPRSAQEFSKTAASGASDDGDSILDHLPPLDLPSDVADKSQTPPVPPAVERKPQTSATASDHVGGRSPREAALTLTRNSAAGEPAASRPSSPSPFSASASPAGPGATPGIARFAAVDLKLAGGSLPSTAGLDWLADKGYKTLVDLRESSQANLDLITAATERGLRYVALPVNVKTIDRDHLARFNFELSLADARPLYFFDGDGTRAGAFWYLRRVLVDHVNPQIARREAVDLGLSDETYWAAATAYLDRQGPAQSAGTDAIGQAAPATADKASASPPKTEKPHQDSATGAETPKAATPTAAPTSASRDADSTLAARDGIQDEPAATSAVSGSSHAATVDPASWQSVAGLMVTGLTFPLAYWGRTAVPTLLAMTRASLPGPARRPKSLPHALDA